MLHFNDVIYGVNLNIRNRNEELTKPLIRLFRNSPAALAEILPVLSEFLNERNEVKKNSFESKLFDVVKNLTKGGEEKGQGQQQDGAADIQQLQLQLQPPPTTVEQNDDVSQEGEGQQQHQPSAYMFTNEELWVESKKVMGGTDILGKSQSFYTVEFGAVSHKKITETFMSKFKAKPYQTGGDDNKRCLIFSKDVLDRIAIYYDLPDKIQILPDEAVEDHDKDGEQKKENRGSNDDSDDGAGGGGSSSQNSTRNAQCEVKSEEQQLQQLGQVTHVTDITDHRNKQALGKENLSAESTLEEELAKQQVTHVTDITHPNDMIGSKEDILQPLHTKNDENNSDIVVELPSSYNNSLDQIAAVMGSTKTVNTPALSPTSVITATCVTKKENDYIYKSKAVTDANNNNNKDDPLLADLPSLSCLFCDNYKTKIRFDMELHLSEKHRHSLVYNLPIGKANMDDRIEYALHLIETGTNTTIPYQIPNSSDGEEQEGEEDEDEYQY